MNLATAGCLVAAVGVTVLWARSYRHCDTPLLPSRHGDRVCVASEFGAMVFEWEGPIVAEIQPTWVYFPSPLPRRWPLNRRSMGFAAYRTTVRHYVRLPPTPVWGVAVPHGALVLLFLIWPTYRLFLQRHSREASRRMRLGLCAACGYDLRASQSCCPECGMQTPAVSPGLQPR